MFKTLKRFYHQKLLRPLIFTSRLGRRAILGHAGKGLFVEYIYNDKPSGYNSIGYLVDRVLLNLPSAQATKNKKSEIIRLLKAEIEQNLSLKKVTKIVDLGSGSARYLTDLSNKNDIQAICFDIDKKSLQKGKLAAGGYPLEYRLGNINRLNKYKNLAEKIAWDPNLCIVSTCYEFLNDVSVRASLEEIYKFLAFGGKLIIVNQISNPNQGLIDNLVSSNGKASWNVNYRKPFIIKKWLIEAGFRDVAAHSDKWNMYCYYSARKIGLENTQIGKKPIFEKSISYGRATEQRSKNIYQYMRGFNPLKNGKAMRGDQKVIMMASNNYLGLAMRDEVIEAVNKAVTKYGATTASSRILTGNLDIHEELQEQLAKFLNVEDALVFSTGYMANLGVMSGLLGEGDVALIDRDAHASLLDGAKLAQGTVRFFGHNSMGQLEKLLKSFKEVKGKVIVCDGVYSMDGDLAPLPEICRLAEKFNAGVIVDDGHVTGIFGKNGRGTPEYFGLEGRVDLLLGSLGKALASVGGFVAGNHLVVDHLRHTSRPLLFSTGLSPANAAAALEALRIIRRESWLIDNLWRNANKMREGLKGLGFNTGRSESPLIPVIIGDEKTTYSMVMALEENGLIVDGVSFPAVKRNMSRIRIRVNATHTESDVEFVLSVFEKIGKKFKVI